MAPGKDGLTYMPEVVINPTWEPYPPHAIDELLVHHLGQEHLDFVEGCLSVPEYSGKTRRHFWAELHYWAARIIQHECDHLDGKLIVDLLDKKQQIFLRNQAIKNRKAGR
jgi:peptide deformylase